MSALLAVQGLGYKKGPAYLLKNIEFTLNRGEIFGLAGRSGSGKSTLLRLLCRLEEPSEGSLRFEDGDWFAVDPRRLRREVTLVFQTPTLLGPTLADDLQLGLRFGNGSDPIPTREWGESLLQRVHLPPGFLGKNPKDLSVGEAQRVALARALAIQPKVLLLDEPTSALDQESKQAIEATLQEAAQSGTSILLVSHDPRQLQSLAKRGLELAKGEMLRTW